ncbi:MAG: hypothetical protein WC762_13050 [Methylobacter sp.]|jgi:hypothetical protein
MKIVFFLVALANVALFMWEYNKGAFKPVIETVQVDQEPILLVSEKPVERKQTVAEDKLPPLGQNDLTTADSQKPAPAIQDEDIEKNIKSGKETPIICYEAGPFADDDDYAAWRSQSNLAESAIHSVSRDEQEISSYLVYYPAAKTLAESEANLKMLKDQGINDILLFKAGEDQGQISIGVFKNENRALLQKSRMLAKGIKVEVKARYKTRTQKYVRFKNDDKVLKSLSDFQKAHPEFTVKQTDNCL